MRKTIQNGTLGAILFALVSAALICAADGSTIVSCKDGTSSRAGKGACSRHGGINKSPMAIEPPNSSFTSTMWPAG